jgi:membrane-associated phospholipid phosphatase
MRRGRRIAPDLPGDCYMSTDFAVDAQTPTAERALPTTAAPGLSFASLWWLAAGLLFAGVLAFSLDLWTVEWLVRRQGLWLLHHLLQSIEAFGDFGGLVLIVGLIYALDPARRGELVRLFASGAGAGLLADVVKFGLISRFRPFPAQAKWDQIHTVWDTFGQWMPLGRGGSVMQSFPSAHTATAVALGIALGRIYPHGRLVFWSLAAAVGLQRVETGAHYLSDVLCGAALGALAAQLCSRVPVIGAKRAAGSE